MTLLSPSLVLLKDNFVPASCRLKSPQHIVSQLLLVWAHDIFIPRSLKLHCNWRNHRLHFYQPNCPSRVAKGLTAGFRIRFETFA